MSQASATIRSRFTDFLAEVASPESRRPDLSRRLTAVAMTFDTFRRKARNLYTRMRMLVALPAADQDA